MGCYLPSYLLSRREQQLAALGSGWPGEISILEVDQQDAALVAVHPLHPEQPLLYPAAQAGAVPVAQDWVLPAQPQQLLVQLKSFGCGRALQLLPVQLGGREGLLCLGIWDVLWAA